MMLRPLVLASTALLPLLASACVYDPYTGTYVPCCAYPAYGYYPYARPAPPPPAPGRIEPGPPPTYQPQSYQPQSYNGPQSYDGPQSVEGSAPAPARNGGGMAQRFAAANTTQDGRLTLAQAQAARWQAVVRNFSAIDVAGKGFVTLADLRAWKLARRQQTASG